MVTRVSEQLNTQNNSASIRSMWGTIFYNAKVYDLVGDGTTNDYTDLYNLINTTINGAEATIIFPKGTYKISSNITIPSNVSLYFVKGAMLSPDSGKTITINGPVEAGLWKIFTGSGTIAGSMKVDFLYPQWWGAKGDGTTDDSFAIIAAVNSILSGGQSRTLFFTPGDYVMRSRFPKITKYMKIVGSSLQGTKITYYPDDGNGILIEAASNEGSQGQYHFEIENITINIVPNNTTPQQVGAIQAYKGTKSTVCQLSRIQNVTIYGYTTFGIQIYTPLYCYLESVNCYAFKKDGLAIRPNATNNLLPNPDYNAIGLDLVGYEQGVIDLFGNSTLVVNCNFGHNKYGVRLLSIGVTKFLNCGFEPNFINLYAYGKTSNSFTNRVSLDTCWIEDYSGACHPTMGAFVLYEFNETTGDLKTPLSIKGDVKLFNTQVHASAAIDNRMGYAFIMEPNGGLSVRNYSDFVDDQVIWRITTNSGYLVKYGTLENYIHNLTKFKNGVASLATNDTRDSSVGAYIKEQPHWYNPKNTNSDKSLQYNYTTITLPNDVTSYFELEIFAKISVSSYADFVMCKLIVTGVTFSNTIIVTKTVTYGDSSKLLAIGGDTGIQLTKTGTNTFSVALKATLSEESWLLMKVKSFKF